MPTTIAPSSRLASGRLAQVAVDDLGVAADLLRGPARQQLTQVQHMDLVGDAGDESEVVLDEDDGRARRRDRSQDLAQPGDLFLVEAGGRLVEQDDAGPSAQGTKDLDQPSGAERELDRLGERQVAEPDLLEQGGGLGAVAAQRSPVAREPQRRDGEADVVTVVAARGNHVAHADPGGDRRGLEGAAHAEVRDLVRL